MGELKLPNFKTYYNATVTNAMRETWVQPLGLGRSPRDGKGYPFQYSSLENSMDCKELENTERLSHSYQDSVVLGKSQTNRSLEQS